MHEIVIHGHFYQPPREEPWLELVPRELSAAPDHDWNERITNQCYRPLAYALVYDGSGRVTRIINAYAWCSFDVGPTLFHWLDRHAADVRDAIVRGDAESRARLGAGNALAMPYHHIILPLASHRDKVTEVRWGIRDFRARFGREPEGMWLPETAVDEETLAVVADEGIRFTILAPHQVRGTPASGRPGRWRGAGGRELAIFVYDGPSAERVAFGDALNDVTRWEASLTASPVASDGGPSIVSLATDGETFGHHHRGGDRALAGLIDRIERGQNATLTNFAAILHTSPPVQDVEIVSPSSWSCPHGVERWRREDGCRFEPGTSQAWRAPLRQGLETLAAGITAIVQREWPGNAGDLWTARDAAGRNLDGVPGLPLPARSLLEIECHVLAMFSSCAWFFDDLARLEPRIVLRHAARALDMLSTADRTSLESALVATLATARSNDTTKGTGADIWYRDIVPDTDGPARLAAGLSALRELAPDALDDVRMPAHDWRVEGDEILIRHLRTGEISRWRAEPVTLGVLAIRSHVRAVPGNRTWIVEIADYPEPVRQRLQQIAAPMIYDAALIHSDAAALHAGLLDASAARDRALAGAWLLVARDGLDDAGIVVHGALDLFDLDRTPPGDTARADAFVHLAAAPPSRARDALAERLGIALGTSPRASA